MGSPSVKMTADVSAAIVDVKTDNCKWKKTDEVDETAIEVPYFEVVEENQT